MCLSGAESERIIVTEAPPFYSRISQTSMAMGQWNMIIVVHTLTLKFGLSTFLYLSILDPNSNSHKLHLWFTVKQYYFLVTLPKSGCKCNKRVAIATKVVGLSMAWCRILTVGLLGLGRILGPGSWWGELPKKTRVLACQFNKQVESCVGKTSFKPYQALPPKDASDLIFASA